ncbi:hypothetical protein DFR29_10210 [Tahibacter aquaticus]|uniref:Uncharacterized protein n=1 Tax=Tahibacter aquaticus TaxID=520092 RepID=A0A4R6Z6H7_9GAMM|nr:hypothetical protein DFR29_10210 [Tahibacter aquaticus]
MCLFIFQGLGEGQLRMLWLRSVTRHHALRGQVPRISRDACRLGGTPRSIFRGQNPVLLANFQLVSTQRGFGKNSFRFGHIQQLTEELFHIIGDVPGAPTTCSAADTSGMPPEAAQTFDSPAKPRLTAYAVNGYRIRRRQVPRDRFWGTSRSISSAPLGLELSVTGVCRRASQQGKDGAGSTQIPHPHTRRAAEWLRF